MHRREAMAVLGAAAWGAGRARAADAPLAYSGLDHLEFFVSNIEQSIAFYTGVFGSGLWKNKRTPRRYLQLGSCYVAFEEAKELRVDHFTAGVEGFDIAAAHKFFEQRGVAYRDYPSGRDLYLADPDGSRLQLTDSKSWVPLTTNTAAPEARPANGEAIFRPVRLDHLLLNVSEPEQAAAFYQEVLGPVSERANGRIWFKVGKSRLGLVRTPSGQRVGLNHYCVSVQPFDVATAAKKLEQAGAKLEPGESAASPHFRDPDGYMIQAQAING